MIAEIVCVGTELLLGDILNTNAQFLAKELAHLGIAVHYQTVVGDNPGRIQNALDIAFDRADLVIMTGGLGPTKDDLTKEMLANYFGKNLVLDEKALDNIAQRVQRYGGNTVSESNKKQAFVPEGSIVLYNENGTAPGYIIDNIQKQGDGNTGKIAVLLPGPPKEMEPMFINSCAPHLAAYSNQTFVSVNVYVKGIGEAGAADKVGDLLDSCNPTVAPYAKENGMHFRVTAAAETKEQAVEMILPVVEKIKGLLGEFITEISDPI